LIEEFKAAHKPKDDWDTPDPSFVAWLVATSDSRSKPVGRDREDGLGAKHESGGAKQSPEVLSADPIREALERAFRTGFDRGFYIADQTSQQPDLAVEDEWSDYCEALSLLTTKASDDELVERVA
jgi:hypothetical protein